jgi:hypothetical protein
MWGSQMSEGLRLTEARIKVFEGINSNERRVAATIQGIWRRLFDKRRFWWTQNLSSSHQTSGFFQVIFSNSLHIGADDLNKTPTVQQEVVHN